MEEEERFNEFVKNTKPKTDVQYTFGLGKTEVADKKQQSSNTSTPSQEEVERKKYYNELMRVLQKGRSQYSPETDAERQKRIKRERSRAIISAVGDGLSAITSMVAAGRGATPTFDADNSLSARWKTEYDKRLAERKEREQQYLNYTSQMANLANNQAEWRRRLDADKAAAAKQADKDARENFIAAARAKLYEAQAEGNIARAEKLRGEIDNAIYMRPYNKDVLVAKAEKLKTSSALDRSKQTTEATKQTKNIAQANKANKDGSSGKDYVTETITETPIVDPISGKPTGETKKTKSTTVKKKSDNKYKHTKALGL